MDAGTPLKTYLDDLQVSSRTGIPAPQLRRLAKRGAVPCLLLPDGTVLFDPDELSEWLSSLRRGGLQAEGQGVAHA